MQLSMELSRDSKKIIALTHKQSLELGSGYLSTEYLLLGFLRAEDRISREVVQKRMDYKELASYITRLYTTTPSDEIRGTTPRYDEALEFAERRALVSGSDQVEPLHLFLGLMASGGENREGMVHRIMQDFEINPIEWSQEAEATL